MSKQVKLEDIVTGMVLDLDVTNPQGAVLLRKGTEITDRHIQIFRTWGIHAVTIFETVSAAELNGQSPEEAAAEQVRALEESLQAKYADVDDDELMQHIKAVTLNHKTRQIKKKYNVA